MKFETKLNRLEEIVSQMEGGDLPLDESLKMFEEGIKMVRECQTQLNAAEQKVKVLMSVDAEGHPVTSDFAAKD